MSRSSIDDYNREINSDIYGGSSSRKRSILKERPDVRNEREKSDVAESGGRTRIASAPQGERTRAVNAGINRSSINDKGSRIYRNNTLQHSEADRSAAERSTINKSAAGHTLSGRTTYDRNVYDRNVYDRSAYDKVSYDRSSYYRPLNDRTTYEGSYNTNSYNTNAYDNDVNSRVSENVIGDSSDIHESDRETIYRKTPGRSTQDRSSLTRSASTRSTASRSASVRNTGSQGADSARRARTYERPDFDYEMSREKSAAEKKRRKLKKRYRAIIAVLLLIIAIIVGGVAFLAMRNVFSEKVSINTYLEDRDLTVLWAITGDWDAMIMYSYDDASGKYVESGTYSGGSIKLENVETNHVLKFRLQPIRYVTRLNGTIREERGATNDFDITVHEMTTPVISAKVDSNKRSVELSWIAYAGAVSEVYRVSSDGSKQLVDSTEKSSYIIEFNSRSELPGKGEEYQYMVRYGASGDGYIQYSGFSNAVSVTRNELLAADVFLNVSLNEDNTLSVTFNEAREDTYELQYMREGDGDWVTLKTFKAEDDLSYTTDALDSERNINVRVIAYNEKDKDNYSESNVETVRTARSVVGSVIWPIKDLPVYSEAQGGVEFNKVKGGEALIVEALEDGKFKIDCGEMPGYVDSNFCMINLPDYLGDICEYNITNSYSSIFKVQDYEIGDITGEVIKGFEKVCIKEGEYLVPYLYPCANKLANAAEAAKRDGYKFKIYEAYRPHVATRFLYDTVTNELDDPVIIRDEDGNIVNDDINPETGEELTEEQKQIKRQQEDILLLAQAQQDLINQGIDIESESGALLVQQHLSELKAANGLSYREAMTNGRFQLSAFLAASTSAHNRGIALDLTLVRISSGDELEMQSNMHDLSYQSICAVNNDNAKLLNKYMTGAGFNDLSSEWWHFQDDETRNAISLNVYLEDGVSLPNK